MQQGVLATGLRVIFGFGSYRFGRRHMVAGRFFQQQRDLLHRLGQQRRLQVGVAKQLAYRLEVIEQMGGIGQGGGLVHRRQSRCKRWSCRA
ncbi:hypothetical protein D3C75_1050710 [compost metagenome]